MLLSEIIGKPVYCGNLVRGTLCGICLSLSTRTVKYLLCKTAEKPANTEFCVSIANVQKIEDGVYLKRIKTVLPKNCARVFLNRPVYTEQGEYLGYFSDLQLDGFIATYLFISGGKRYPASALSAVSDALILKKTPTYPIGQRIPASPVIEYLSKNGQNSPVVTRAVLKTAIQSEKLISLTLSLPPFNKNVL